MTNLVIDLDVKNSNKEMIEKTFISKDEAILGFLCLLESLSFEVCNPDVWWLAMNSAKQKAVKEYGMSEEAFLELMQKFETLRKAKNKNNPMHSMFN